MTRTTRSISKAGHSMEVHLGKGLAGSNSSSGKEAEEEVRNLNSNKVVGEGSNFQVALDSDHLLSDWNGVSMGVIA